MRAAIRYIGGMSTQLAVADRKRLAERLGLSEPYLYQCLTGRRDMDPGEAMSLEIRSGGELKRWSLRQRDWFRIWPELIGAEGAPAVPHGDANA